VLRPLILTSQFITTNIGGLAWSGNWDHYAISADLDLASWDDYVAQGHLDAAKNAMLNDFVRGWRRENFWVMETQPGSVNWAGVNNTLDRGDTRAGVADRGPWGGCGALLAVALRTEWAGGVPRRHRRRRC
jgi:beta-galactosidase